MKVAILAPYPVSSLPGFGHAAAGHHATWLPPLAAACEPQVQGMEVHWVTCAKEVGTHRTLEKHGQHFHLLPRGSLGFEIVTRFCRERRIILGMLGSIAPDIVHAWGTEQGYAAAAMDSGLPWMLSMQGLLQSLCRRERQHWLLRVQANLERKVLRHARAITVESSWAEREIRKYAPDAEISRLTYGISALGFNQQRNPDPQPTVLFVGTLSKSKGVDTLLKAFEDPRLSSVRLVLLGDGPLKGTSTDRIRFEGHVEQATVFDWMRRAWALAHPTLADACPNSVKEARVIGLPVVTTPDGGQTDWVRDGESGFLHESGNVDGLIRGLLRCVESRQTSLEIGAKHRELAQAMADPAESARRMVGLWRELAARSGRWTDGVPAIDCG